LLAILLEEIEAAGDPAQTEAFLIAVGRRFAGHHPLARDVANSPMTLDVLVHTMNAVWASYDLGAVAVSTASDGYGLVHTLGGFAAGPLNRLMGPFLEGCYDAWMRSLGSGAALRTLRTDHAAGCVRFWHGR